MRPHISFMIIVALLTVMISSFQQSAFMPDEFMEVTALVEISALIPKITLTGVGFHRNIFSVDSQENIYFIDSGNHRILKFDNKGEFISQIGSIGQGKNSLFSPSGIYIKKESIYILNDAGRELKIFSLDGEYLSSFKIENAWSSKSLCVYGDHIFIT